VFERDGTHRAGFRQPQVDGDAAVAILARGERAPISDAAAVCIKMKAKRPPADVDVEPDTRIRSSS